MPGARAARGLPGVVAVALVALAPVLAPAGAAEAAAAQADGDGPLTARAVGWQGGEAAAGRLLQLQHLGAAGAFQLEAAWLEVRTVATETYAKVPGQAAFSGPAWTSEVAEHTAVRLASTGAQARADGFAFVAPLDGADPAAAPTLALGCGMDAHAADGGVPQQVPSQVETPNPNPVLDLERALLVAPCSQVRVCGALTVALWERDAGGASGEGPLELRSGELPRDGPDLRPALGRAQQVYLSTPDGCLTLEPTGATRLLVEGLALAGARAMALSEAAGPVAGVPAPQDSSVALEGSLDARLERAGGRVLVGGLAGVESARADGAPLAVAVAAPDGGRPAPLLWGLLAVPALAAAAAWTWQRRRAGATDRMLDRMYGAADRADAPRVQALATQVLERDAHQLEAWTARAVAHLDLQRFDDSLADCRRALELLGFRSPAQRAAIEIVACRASSLKGDTEGAVRWLGEAYVNDLPSAQSAMQYPEVRRLLNTPGYS